MDTFDGLSRVLVSLRGKRRVLEIFRAKNGPFGELGYRVWAVGAGGLAPKKKAGLAVVLRGELAHTVLGYYDSRKGRKM